MTGADLDRLEALCVAATAGPWFAHVNDLVGGWCVMTVDATPAAGQSPSVADFTDEAVARFIAAARTAVLALIARVRELEAILDDKEASHQEMLELRDMAKLRANALSARVRELEALLSPAIPDFYTCGCASAPKDVLHAFCPQHKQPMRTRTEETP